VADLTNLERRKLERLLDMSGGYVLNFVNRTFADFVLDCTGKDIYDARYENGSGSKAQRLRAFWHEESNYLVGKLIDELVSLAVEIKGSENPELIQHCRQIAARLSQGNTVPELDAITSSSAEPGFEALVREIRQSIEKDEPETALDRLHTFVIKYMRTLCAERGISVDRDKPLHSLVGEYIKKLKECGEIESEMTERILKSNISLMEAFNRVRNESSLAHDNEILNYDESLLIVNHVAIEVRFIKNLESRRASIQNAPQEAVAIAVSDIDDIPF
jgi:hypothetical protein